VAVGISVQEIIPASVSNDVGPMLRELIEVIPVDESYSSAPPSTVSPELMVVVALLFDVVSIVIMGVAVVEVAIENA